MLLDTKTLGQDLKRIYSLGYFEIVSYAIVEDGQRRILKITPTPKSWGPTYLKLGLFLGTDFQLTTDFGVTALVDATEMNGLGGEWKTTVTVGDPIDLKTRFFQPLTYRSHLFLSPYGGWNQSSTQVYDENEIALGTYQVSRAVVGMDRRLRLRDLGRAARRLRARVGPGAAARSATPTFPDVDWDEGGLTARMEVDQLDNVNLPHSGYFSDITFLANRESLGGSTSYDRFAASALGVQTIGRWTGLIEVEGGSSLGTQIPFYDEFQLGGLFRLSGRPIGQLRGNTYALGTAAALLPALRHRGPRPQEPLDRRFGRGRQHVDLPGSGHVLEPEAGGQHFRRGRHPDRAALRGVREVGKQEQLGVSLPEPDVLNRRWREARDLRPVLAGGQASQSVTLGLCCRSTGSLAVLGMAGLELAARVRADSIRRGRPPCTPPPWWDS